MNPILKKLYMQYKVAAAKAGKKPYPFGKWVVMRTNKISSQLQYGWKALL